MATPDIETYNKYYGNGETTEFSVSFPYSKRECVKVYVRRVGFEQVSVDPKDYEFVNDNTIRYPSNTSSDDVLRDGDIITIQRETTVASEFIFSNQRRLFPEDVMNADDLSFEILQEQARELNRAITVDPTSEVQPKVLLEKVDLVYNRIDDIETVAQNIGSVDTVSNNIGVVTDVAQIKEDVSAVSQAQAEVIDVSEIKDSVVTVAGNTASVKSCADNINAIVDAPNQAESARQSAEAAASSAAVSNPPPLLTHSWEDHILNDIRYLRADTFSWQDGEMYKAAYNHLVDDWNASSDNIQNEIINGTQIFYRLAEDGHKICSASQEDEALAIYNATGVAWYYILDIENKRFKLPRELPITDKIKGNGLALGISSSTAGYTEMGLRSSASSSDNFLQASVAASATSVGSVTTDTGYYGDSRRSLGIVPNPDKSGIISHRENENGQQYLYFYVGNFTQSAIEQTAGLNAELFNGKADVDSVMLKENMQVVSELPAIPVDDTYYFVVTDE